MKISKTIICASIAAIILLGCKTQNTLTQKSDSEKGVYSFQKTLQFEELSFNVITKGEGSLRQLSVKSDGFEKSNLSFEIEIDGLVTDAQVADLNSDGFAELLVFTQSAGSGSYGNVIAFSSNGKKSMSQAYFPPVHENPKLSKGYMGHDVFLINKSVLIHEFPIYKEDDPNSNPTGGIRRIEYKLIDGEASRMFVPNTISESPSK